MQACTHINVWSRSVVPQENTPTFDQVCALSIHHSRTRCPLSQQIFPFGFVDIICLNLWCGSDSFPRMNTRLIPYFTQGNLTVDTRSFDVRIFSNAQIIGIPISELITKWKRYGSLKCEKYSHWQTVNHLLVQYTGDRVHQYNSRMVGWWLPFNL